VQAQKKQVKRKTLFATNLIMEMKSGFHGISHEEAEERCEECMWRVISIVRLSLCKTPACMLFFKGVANVNRRDLHMTMMQPLRKGQLISEQKLFLSLQLSTMKADEHHESARGK
jgi:hypothetical protein